MDIKRFVSEINSYVSNYNLKENVDFNSSNKLILLIKELDALPFDKKHSVLSNLLKTNLKEVYYFVVSYLFNRVSNKEECIKSVETVDVSKLTSSLSLNKLQPFKLYASMLLETYKNEDKSSCNDIYYMNENFNSIEDLCLFLQYEVFNDPFNIKSISCKENDFILNLKNLSKDLRSVLLLNMFVKYSTHRASKNYIDLSKLFFNSNQVYLGLSKEGFSYLYDEMINVLNLIDEGEFTSLIKKAKDVIFKKVIREVESRGSVDYASLYKDLHFLKMDEEVLFNLEDTINSKYTQVIKKVNAYIRKLVKSNKYLSILDEKSDLLAKKLLVLLCKFSMRNFSVSYDICNIVTNTEEDLLYVTINKIKDLRSYESLALIVVLNLCNIDCIANRRYIEKFIQFDTKLRNDLGKSCFNFSKFLYYYIKTGDYDRDSGLIISKSLVKEFEYSDFDNVTDFTNYIYNRFSMLNELGIEKISNDVFESLYIVNNLYVYFVYNNSLDVCLRLVYNLYHSFDKLLSALSVCSLSDISDILKPIVVTIE